MFVEKCNYHQILCLKIKFRIQHEKTNNFWLASVCTDLFSLKLSRSAVKSRARARARVLHISRIVARKRGSYDPACIYIYSCYFRMVWLMSLFPGALSDNSSAAARAERAELSARSSGLQRVKLISFPALARSFSLSLY